MGSASASLNFGSCIVSCYSNKYMEPKIWSGAAQGEEQRQAYNSRIHKRCCYSVCRPFIKSNLLNRSWMTSSTRTSSRTHLFETIYSTWSCGSVGRKLKLELRSWLPVLNLLYTELFSYYSRLLAQARSVQNFCEYTVNKKKFYSPTCDWRQQKTQRSNGQLLGQWLVPQTNPESRPSPVK